MKILLIDDDNGFCSGLARRLAKINIACDIADKGNKGIQLAKHNTYDLVILDLILPDMNGHDVLLKFRHNNIQVPVIILTGQRSVEQKIMGFEKGADDYLSKPFAIEELIARIQAVTRRAKGYSSSIINAGVLTLNLNRKILTIGDKIVELTSTEYKILELLILRQGSTLHKDIFFEYVYAGTHKSPDPKIIDVFICKIRKKIDQIYGYELNYIQTIWGRGYAFAINQGEEQNLARAAN